MKKTVVIGLLGTQLDLGKGSNRWGRWRPSVDLCRFDDLVVDRFELISQRRFKSMARQVADDIGSVSPETEVVVRDVPFRDPWDFEEVYGRLHDFARDYPFRPEEEDYLIHMTTGTHVAQICLFLLTESHRLPARLIQTSPPLRQRRKDGGPGSYTIIDLDLSRYDRLAARFQLEKQSDRSFLKSGIETRNGAFNTLIERIERVSISSLAPILLMGPTGAGKSQLAKRIYQLKQRRRQVAGPLVEVNCATLRGDQAMSALFGHVKGAFTGAAAERPGLLRTADTGLLFLDEVGELGLDEQAMLLRAIEEKRFLPVGTDREVESNFQLIAGTNRNLLEAVSEGCFREDLLARINLWTFQLPGLRDRREDIEPNLEYELEQWARESGSRVAFNKQARKRFLDFACDPETPWSGNFREFNAAVVRMSTLAEGGRINEELVKEEVARLRSGWKPGSSASTHVDLTEVMGVAGLSEIDRFDQAQLSFVLSICLESSSLSEAGRRLYNVSRTRRAKTNDADRLRKYLARFGLSWADLQGRRQRSVPLR